jgi:hypothetical protein
MRQLLARMEPTFAPGAYALGTVVLVKITTIKTKTTR